MHHYSRCTHGLSCYKGEEVHGAPIIVIHFNLDRHALFSDEDAEADAKRLTQLFSRKNSLYLHLGIHSGKQVSGSERKASNVKLFTWILVNLTLEEDYRITSLKLMG